MKSAKEFAAWLHQRFEEAKEGVYLTREDIATLSGRQRFNLEFISDIHFELTLQGMGFVTDTHRERFYLFHLPTAHWQDQGDRYHDSPNIHQMSPAKRNSH
ncbi:hypothetical protein [Zobellella taiwanensis]|jgi:hypothetical protein|uniref:Uncharacterized protein n=1 Tax=Zobellella taiwanensis TaxID=347535 RepID=A0A2P7QIU2_9GAMM|nr:hypothetical protein [Zobellella taiwanensis]PSJ37866.1 hypothetical protein C7I36_15000 [Zobellella taiwanensis]